LLNHNLIRLFITKWTVDKFSTLFAYRISVSFKIFPYISKNIPLKIILSSSGLALVCSKHIFLNSKIVEFGFIYKENVFSADNLTFTVIN
jgi:hypothetical protein